MIHDFFMPHGMCYLWNPAMMGLQLTGDLVTALAYFAIPTLLYVAVKDRPQTPITPLVPWFIAFILLCGITHVLEIIVIWYPIYWVSGWVKLATAAVSIMACKTLYQAVRQFLEDVDRLSATDDLTLTIRHALEQFRRVDAR